MVEWRIKRVGQQMTANHLIQDDVYWGIRWQGKCGLMQFFEGDSAGLCGYCFYGHYGHDGGTRKLLNKGWLDVRVLVFYACLFFLMINFCNNSPFL
jgi:hypothetical protein